MAEKIAREEINSLCCMYGWVPGLQGRKQGWVCIKADKVKVR